MSRYDLFFAHRITYPYQPDIVVPVALSFDSATFIPIDAKLDTGSIFCVFQRHFAELFGLSVESGAPERIGTATGSFLAYGHELTVSACGLEWQAIVYFAESETFPINVVGRVGFLDRLRVALIDYEQELYLSHYEDV